MESPENSLGAYLVGGFLFFATGVLLLFHCSSMSHRKQRRRVEHGAVHGGNDDRGKNRKSMWPWRGSRKKTRMADIVDFPSVTIVVTPPTPITTPRCAEKDSIGSSSDLARNPVITETATNNNNAGGGGDGVGGGDCGDGGGCGGGGGSGGGGGDDTKHSEVVALGDNDVDSEEEQSSNIARTRDVESATSLCGIRDVTLVTELNSTALSKADPCVLEDRSAVFRPRVYSVESSVTTTDESVTSWTDNGKDCSGQG